MANYINLAAQTAAQLSRRLQENLTENARDFAFENGARYLDAVDDRVRDVKHLLESRYDREKLEGLKRLIAVSIVNANLPCVGRIHV